MKKLKTFSFYLISSIAYNITRKMEWMGRRLRYIDEAEDIKEWVAAMSALNALLKEVDSKGCLDNWKPWKKKGSGEGMLKEAEFTEL